MNYWRIILLGILSILIIFIGLGDGSLRDWDEAIYAQISKEMILNSDHLTLHYGYKPWFEKPPLLMWTTAIFYRLFGINEFWARAASAFSGVGLIIITYLIGNLVYNRRTGLIASLILLCSYEFLERARMGTTDTMLCFLFFVAVYAYLRLTIREQKWWYLFWISFALAFMLKSWAALIMLPIIASAVLLHSYVIDTLQSRHFWLGALLAFVLILPWHIIMYAKHGQIFIDEYFMRHGVMRTLTTLEGHYGGPLFYIYKLPRLFSPWVYLLPFAFTLNIKENIEGQSKSRILLILIVIVFGFYSLIVKTKLSWYINPIYPALAILIASLFMQAFQSYKSSAFIGIIFTTLISIFIAPKKLLFLFILAGVLILITRITNLINKKSYQIAVIFMFIFFLAISFTSTIRRNHRIGSYEFYCLSKSPVAKIAEIAGSTKPNQQKPIIGVALEDDLDTIYAVEGPTALFYSNRPIEVAWDLAQLEDFIGKHEEKEIILAEKYLQSLLPDYEIQMKATVKPLVFAKIRHREDS